MTLQQTVVWIIDKIHYGLDWARTTLAGALPKGTMFGFFDWTTAILLLASLIIAFVITMQKYVSMNALFRTGKQRLLVTTAIIFIFLRYL